MGTQHPHTDTAAHFSAHVYCGQTVDHLSYTAGLLLKVLTLSAETTLLDKLHLFKINMTKGAQRHLHAT